MSKMDKLQHPLSVVILLQVLCVAYASAALNLPIVPFSKGFNPLFGEPNILSSTDDQSVQIHLNKQTGSGFRSSDLYNHGFFSAKIKLPSNYTAGIVVAFYVFNLFSIKKCNLSIRLNKNCFNYIPSRLNDILLMIILQTTNEDIFRKTHDELDFEFLGNIKGKAWRFQTNMYGNGSTNRGREERYYLPFDPSKEFHRYSILWTTKNIIFYIDNIPIREIVRNEAMGADFPSKPMGLYATIWDASDWATNGGKYRADYKYAPFVAEFTDLVLHGCIMDPLEEVVAAARCDNMDDQLIRADFANINHRQRMAMKKFRSRFMYYSYCYDTLRYSMPLPECVIDSTERKLYKDTGRLKFDGKQRRRFKRKGQVGVRDRNHENQDED